MRGLRLPSGVVAVLVVMVVVLVVVVVVVVVVVACVAPPAPHRHLLSRPQGQLLHAVDELIVRHQVRGALLQLVQSPAEHLRTLLVAVQAHYLQPVP
jgi:hypothetical protein